MKKPNEHQIIRIFQKRFGRKSKFVPEDVELLRIGSTSFIVKSDMLVQSTDVPHGMKFEQIARKAMISPISDFAVKGVKPLYATISIAIPKKTSKSAIKKLAKGFEKASKEFDVKIVGGDLNEGKEIIVEVSLFGISKKIVHRKGAKIGDLIMTSGPFGYSASGLQIILKHSKANSSFLQKCKHAVYLPAPRLKFDIDIARYISSSMDSSDGLSTTLNELSKQSCKRFIVTKLPCYADVRKFAKQNKIKLLDLVFNGGEEFEMVFTVSPKKITLIKKIARNHHIPLFEIGHVTRGKGVVYQENENEIAIKNKGWIHFKS